MKSNLPDLSLPILSWNWPCFEEVLAALPQFKLPLSDEDKERFWNGLCRSLSLSYEEKLRVIEAVPTLSEAQVRSLMEVWDDEEKGFYPLLHREPSEISKLVGAMATRWLLIWEKMGLKRDDKEIGVVAQFIDMFISGNVVKDFAAYEHDSFFWLGCISVMNKYGHADAVNKALTLLERTLEWVKPAPRSVQEVALARSTDSGYIR